MKDRRVLITGAGRGIGRDMALAFAREGAVVALSARSGDELEAVARAITAASGEAYSFPCDVTDVGQVTSLREQVTSRIGGVDVLVNNAGVGGSHKFLGHPDALWQRILDVNLTGVYNVTKAFAPGMVEQKWGRIINIASTAALTGGRYIAAYTASKHGVLGLTRALAVELAPHVTANAICPGYVDTPMTAQTVKNIVEKTGMTEEAARAALEKENLQRRLIQPEEVTAVALFLARKVARGITGQALQVDGGSIIA